MSVRSYVCPGDTHEISRPVHLARLAAEYSACEACSHRHDLGGLKLPERAARTQQTLVSRAEAERIWRPLRQPTARQEVLELAAAVVSELWTETPWDLPLSDWDSADSSPPSGPLVAIGGDESAAAQALAADVVRSVSRNGCRVVSLGTVSRPVLDFAVDHLGCAAGLHVLGGGSPAGLGFSVVSAGSKPWSAEGRLGLILNPATSRAGRPSRQAGAVRQFDAVPAYRESLVRHFPTGHRPEIAVVGMTECVRQVWEPLSARVSCTLKIDSTSVGSEGEPGPAVLKPLQEAVVSGRLAGGVALGGDHRAVWVIDRRAGLASSRSVAGWIAAELRREAGERELRGVVPENSMWTDLNVPGVRLSFCGPGEEALVGAMISRRAAFGCDARGRFWIADPAPRCDSLLTLAYIARHWAEEQRQKAAA